MKSSMLPRCWAAASLLFAVLALASCINSMVNKAVGDAQAASISSATGEAVAGGDPKEAEAKLRALKDHFEDNAGVQANLSVRIAMLTTIHGTRQEASKDWESAGRYWRSMTPDHRALYDSREGIVFFFSRPDGSTLPLSQGGAPDEGDEKGLDGTVKGLEAISVNRTVSRDLRIWATAHWALAAFLQRNAEWGDQNFQKARAALDEMVPVGTEASSGMASFITRLRGRPGYRR